MKKVELTILIPCLNEEKTIGICIKKAQNFLKENNINGEVLVIDNGCTDKSIDIAKELGARVEFVKEKGYGNALINGSKLANGKYTIMGDADDSYNFAEILPIYEKLKEGYELVIGNRYTGKLEKGAMKFTHQYIGTPVISFMARKKFEIPVRDFNCGLRGYNTELIKKLQFQSTGMEYATEMIIKAKQENLKIIEIPINFYKDGREGASHLNAIKDGISILKIIFQNKK